MSCTPCIAELQGLNEIVDQYQGQEDVKFISFTYNRKEVLAKDFSPMHEYQV